MTLLGGRLADVERRREVARIRRIMERLHSPRLQMMLLVALTAAVGFLASTALLYSHVDALWLRYPAAVAVAYVAFLFFLWCWLYVRSDQVMDGLDLASELDVPFPGPTPCPGSGSTTGAGDAAPDGAFEFGGGSFGGGGTSGSFADAPDPTGSTIEIAAGGGGSGSKLADAAAGVFDLEELAVVLVAIAALIGALWAALWMVWAAPLLLAELLFDAALAAGLYRRLRGVHGDHWLRTALRRTAGPFVAVAVLFSLAGGILQLYAPDARSIGQVMRVLDEAR